MPVQWGLAQPQGGGFDYLDSLQAIGNQRAQQQQMEQRQYSFDRTRQQDQSRIGLADRARTGDFAGARQEAALGGDFDFANALGGLDEDKIKRLSVELDAIGQIHPALKALPVEQRAQVGSAALARVGFSPQELANMDWSDAGLDVAYQMSAAGKAALAARLKQQEARVVGDGGALVNGTGEVLYENQKAPEWQFDGESGSWLQKPGTGQNGGQPGYAPQGASPAGGNTPRSVRNNNPGNIIDSPFARSQPGYQGSDGRFAKFADPQSGSGAQAALLGSYIDRGFNTVEKIINRWAPPSENDTGAYVRSVAKALNVNPGDTLSKSSIPALQRIISRVEGGPGGSSAGQPAAQPGVVNVRPPRAKSENAPSGYRFNGDKLEPIPGGPADPATATSRNVQSNRKAEADYRKEFDQLPEVKTFKVARQQFNTLRDLGTKKNPTPQDDIAMIFTYMKTLDPGSVVREGEFATAQNAAGIDDTIRNQYNKVLNGTRLNAQQRQNMVRTGYSNYKNFRQAYNQQAENFRGYARDNGISPDRVARTYTPDAPAARPAVKQITPTIRRIN